MTCSTGYACLRAILKRVVIASFSAATASITVLLCRSSLLSLSSKSWNSLSSGPLSPIRAFFLFFRGSGFFCFEASKWLSGCSSPASNLIASPDLPASALLFEFLFNEALGREKVSKPIGCPSLGVSDELGWWCSSPFSSRSFSSSRISLSLSLDARLSCVSASMTCPMQYYEEFTRKKQLAKVQEDLHTSKYRLYNFSIWIIALWHNQLGAC